MTNPGFNFWYSVPGVLTKRSYKNGVYTGSSDSIVRKQYVMGYRPGNISTGYDPRKKGVRPMTPWTRSGGVMNGVYGTANEEYSSGGNVYSTRWIGQVAAPGLSPGAIPKVNKDLEIEAIRAALGKYTEAYVQLGAALREARETSALLQKYYRNAATLTYKTELAVRGSKRVRNQFRDFLRHGWKAVPAVHLEYLFGIKPLADDLTNAAQVLTSMKSNGMSFNMRLKGKRKAQTTSRVGAYQSFVGGSLLKADESISQVSRAVLMFQLPDWYWDTLPPVSFFGQLWETTRLSFVLDWALPIQNWIAGFEGFQLKPFFSKGSRSTMLRRTVTGCYSDDGRVSPIFIPEGRDFTYSRRVFTEWPGEELFSLPRFRSVFNIGQVQVGAALLGQRLASLSRAIGH